MVRLKKPCQQIKQTCNLWQPTSNNDNTQQATQNSEEWSHCWVYTEEPSSNPVAGSDRISKYLPLQVYHILQYACVFRIQFVLITLQHHGKHGI